VTEKSRGVVEVDRRSVWTALRIRQDTKTENLTVFGDSRRSRRQSPFSVAVPEFSDYSLQCGQGLTINDRTIYNDLRWY